MESEPAIATTRGALTRRTILGAAIARFGRDGYRSTSVADIARDAEVGGTLVYAYFANKEALFLAALDEDAAGVIDEGVSSLLEQAEAGPWRETLVLALLDALERHVLARRVLSGLEPHATHRMLEIPAMAELRKALAERLRSDQAAGTVRPDIDATAIANGAVIMVVSLLMSALQFGRDGVSTYGDDVLAVLAAALDPR
jgi:AcrR family transcriptional regulator